MTFAKSALRRTGSLVGNLHPEYFAIVMATGMLSLACRGTGLEFATWPLLGLNWAIYLILWVLTLLRISFYTKRFLSDLRDARRAVGFFTIPAGTCILASQAAVLTASKSMPLTLLGFGIVLWFFFLYLIFTILAVRPEKSFLGEGITPAWLLPTVATQTLSIVMALVSASVPEFQQILLLTALCLLFIGATLYSITVTLIFHRLMFFELRAAELTSSYWIVMGAEATTVLAAANLLIHGSAYPAFSTLRPVIAGAAVLFWGTATFWIPLLLSLGFWRYIIHRSGSFYSPLHWGMAYPLGTYTYGTLHLSKAYDLAYLAAIPPYFVYIAMTAWIWSFAGYLWSLSRIHLIENQED